MLIGSTVSVEELFSSPHFGYLVASNTRTFLSESLPVGLQMTCSLLNVFWTLFETGFNVAASIGCVVTVVSNGLLKTKHAVSTVISCLH